jgi:ABC-type polysaccharide/polyol phosphate transport system ATPase subunit
LQTSPDGTVRAGEVWKRFRAEQRIPKLRENVQRLTGRRASRNGDGWLWALREADFLIQPGESVGLVGANGSGKSTLLKILTRVMYPTAGSVEVAGRVGALIELRAGIHPELTGRENIYLTGSLMGLGRRRVAERFDEIVAFSELEEAIDRQVKYYSSGMWMRLGFGVAAFLEPDILLVDEVLAVGDASFQQRCLDRMRYVMSQGTTLVFVSHDLAAVEATCNRGLWLHRGDIMADGPIRDVLGRYRQSVEAGAETHVRVQGRIGLESVEVRAADGGVVRTQEALDVRLVLESDKPYRSWVYLGVTEGTATPIFVLNPGRETSLEPGATTISCSIENLPLPSGRYYVWAAVYQDWTDGPELLGWQPIAQFDVYGPELDRAPVAVVRLAPVHVSSSWSIARAEEHSSSLP